MNDAATGSSEVIVATRSCYLALYDLAHPRIQRDMARLAMKSAEEESAQDGIATLVHFNDYWARGRRDRAIAVWGFLFDGVFKIQLRVGSDPHHAFLWLPDGFVGGSEAGSMLDVPSGRVAVTDLSDVGQRRGATAVIQPGRYRVGLEARADQLSRHEFLDEEGQYPNEDGPDWVVHMQPLELPERS